MVFGDEGFIFFAPVHLRMCFSKVLAMLKGMSHSRHFMVSLPVRPCVFIWRVSLLDCAQLYGHSSHLYGFSPVCDRRWTVRLEQFLNTLPQNSQVSLRPLLMISLRASGSNSASSRPFCARARTADGSINGIFMPGGKGGSGMSFRDDLGRLDFVTNLSFICDEILLRNEAMLLALRGVGFQVPAYK